MDGNQYRGVEDKPRHLFVDGGKKNPNVRSYWTTSTPFLHCPIISSKMTQTRFELITRCLHVTNPATLQTNRMSPLYNKVGKVKWLVNDLRAKFQYNFNLGRIITISEMMLRYKVRYCPITQYMPNKPVKLGVKVWCLTDSTSKYMWDFIVNQGACKSDANVAKE